MSVDKIAGETALELIKNENVQNKMADVFGMLFPYAGIKKKAVDMYIAEVEKSNLPSDAKLIALLNAKKELKRLFQLQLTKKHVGHYQMIMK